MVLEVWLFSEELGSPPFAPEARKLPFRLVYGLAEKSTALYRGSLSLKRHVSGFCWCIQIYTSGAR